MIKSNIYFPIIFFLLTLLGCHSSYKPNSELNNNSYITNFELLQENPTNDTQVRITSPKAILDPNNNDIEIFESAIEIINKQGQNLIVNSGKTTLNNSSDLIKVFNNVKITFMDNSDYYILTNSFNWDLNTSILKIDSPIKMNLDNTNIIASNGIYNINSSLFNIDNSIFSSNAYNSEGIKQYVLQIKSDLAKWFKNENMLVFTSNDKQVEATINFLATEHNE